MGVVSTRGFRPARPAAAAGIAAQAREPAAEARGPAADSDRECRCLMAGVELRAAKGKGPGTVVGYAAVFDLLSEDLGGFREKISPGAFAEAIARSDVRALKNHDANLLLGRGKSGTLRMAEDRLGLRVEIDLPDTQVGRDTAVEVGRGDMDGMSFSFVVDADSWDYSGDVAVRTLLKVRDLYDIGPVVYPAYTDTSAAMRSLEARRRPEPPPPATAAEVHFDPLDSFRFRIQVEQASVLPAIGVTHESV